MYEILENREAAPNIYKVVLRAPSVAGAARPGQFVIVMVDEKAERIPYTLSDWDREAGTITLMVQEFGRSSRRLVLLQAGDNVAHVAGPLGLPLEIERFGTVALAAGCYGVGAILGIARAMRAAGNKVISIAEADSHYMHYFQSELKAVSDEYVRTTIDGSDGRRGHAIDVVKERLERGDRLDRVIAVGCTFMMMLAGETTKPYGVKTLVALNPIMLDGTGMCGACRVTVDHKTLFACVDGPFFDAHQVDWEELRNRRKAYGDDEVFSVATTAPVVEPCRAPNCWS